MHFVLSFECNMRRRDSSNNINRRGICVLHLPPRFGPWLFSVLKPRGAVTVTVASFRTKLNRRITVRRLNADDDDLRVTGSNRADYAIWYTSAHLVPFEDRAYPSIQVLIPILK